jgi:Ni/Co efflux regulator RcnB
MIVMHRQARIAALVAAAAIAAGSAFAATTARQKQAESPPAPTEQVSPAGQARYGVKLGGFFTDQHKTTARRAFAQRYGRAKDCPEGMERNTSKVCMPPVVGRYWAIGQSLQPAVKEYPVPDVLVSKLPAPPEGYRYALVGDDIVLMSSATKLVVDIIEDVSS